MLPETWHNRVATIDLHRLAHHSVTSAWWQAKDLAQLLYSSELAGVTARDRVRFWKFYRSQWPGTPPSEWLVRLIKWKWRFYRRHARRRKTLDTKSSNHRVTENTEW